MKKVQVLIAVLFASITFCHAQYSKTNYFSESYIKEYLKDNIASLDPIEGIYNVRLNRKSVYSNGEVYDRDFSYRCAIVRIGDNKYKVFDETVIKTYGSATMHSELTLMTRIGETSAYSVDLKYTPIYSDERLVNVNSRIVLESLLQFDMSVKVYYPIPRRYVDLDVYDGYNFIKEYPTTSMYKEVVAKHEEESKSGEWTGTGYAVGNGYIVTNNHVADGAKSITIKGVKGDMNKGYYAEVVATDKTNDIAILKINDSRFNGFGVIPYSVSARMADVGEDIFVLGYPLTQALGNEIKLTNGIISSRTGYQGDVATYQMSAPVQPGNSGGPMFDSKGNVVGIVVAGVPGAENVGYAIKISYLKNLIESAGLNIRFPANNTVAGLSLAEKVKRVRNFVFYIECSDKNMSSSRQTPSNNEMRSGYVDLGLPSGTYWKSDNEDGFYTYNEAVSKYAGKLPTKMQWEELKNKCKWTWTGNGYKVTGPNGKIISLPACGWSNKGRVNLVGKSGYYRTSEPKGEYESWGIFFNSGNISVSFSDKGGGHSVRLVQNN